MKVTLPTIPWIAVSCMVGFMITTFAACSQQLNSSKTPPDDVPVHPEEVEGDVAKGQALYQRHCLTCHGASGRGDGATGLELKADIPDFTHTEQMYLEGDQTLFNVIKYGGRAMDKSGFMHAWRETFTDQDIRDLILYIRTLSRPMA